MTASRPLGVVLAGGSSTRMGEDKAGLSVHGERLVDRAARLLLDAGLEVVVADRGRSLISGLPSVADGGGRGPAAGLLGAAAAYPARTLMVLACDLPNVSTRLLETLRSRPDRMDWVVPRHEGYLESLCARYGERALSALRRRVDAGDFALHHLENESSLQIDYLEGAELESLGAPDELFENLNSPDDLRRLNDRSF